MSAAILRDQDFQLDLLLYHRPLKRLVAVELKIGKFDARHEGQMKLYLKWLNRYERQEGEEAPIGLILCTEASREQVELLEMDKDGIVVAEYWTAALVREGHEFAPLAGYIDAARNRGRVREDVLDLAPSPCSEVSGEHPSGQFAYGDEGDGCLVRCDPRDERRWEILLDRGRGNIGVMNDPHDQARSF